VLPLASLRVSLSRDGELWLPSGRIFRCGKRLDPSLSRLRLTADAVTVSKRQLRIRFDMRYDLLNIQVTHSRTIKAALGL
jgi:hypothetical protein